jgi:hypothetical protein
LYAGGTMNLYGFVEQNPLRYTDPTGLVHNTCMMIPNAGVYDTTWHLIQVRPGTQVSSTSVGAMYMYEAIYAKHLFELLYCCDATDAGYYRWADRTLYATASDTNTGNTAPATVNSVPLPIPLGYGQAIDLSAIILMPSKAAWVGVTPNIQRHASLPMTLTGFGEVQLPPSGIYTLQTLTPVNCSCGLASASGTAAIGAGAGVAGPPAGATPPPVPSHPKPPTSLGLRK